MLTEQQMLIAEVAFTSGQSNGYASAKGLEPEISVDDWLADPELQIELSQALSDIPALAYTTDPPTEPGWYWYRLVGAIQGSVVKVAEYGRVDSLAYLDPFSEFLFDVNDPNGPEAEWCRIQEPKP